MFDNYNPCLFFTRQRILTNFSPINLSKNIIQNNFYEDRRIVKTSVVFSQNKYIYFWKIFVPTILLITVENWFKDFFGRTNFDLYSINWFAFVTKKRNPFGKNWSTKNNKTRALHRMHSEKRIFSLRIQRKRNSKEALGRSQSFQRKDDPLSCSHIGQNDIVESVESKEYPIISIVECDHSSDTDRLEFFPPIRSLAQFPRGILPFAWPTSVIMCLCYISGWTTDWEGLRSIKIHGK